MILLHYLILRNDYKLSALRLQYSGRGEDYKDVYNEAPAFSDCIPPGNRLESLKTIQAYKHTVIM